MTNRSVNLNADAIALENARFMSRVYSWMTGGILVTAFVASAIASDERVAMMLVQNRLLLVGLAIAQIGAVLYMSVAINRIAR